MSKGLDLFLRLNWSGGAAQAGLQRMTGAVGAFSRTAASGLGRVADQARKAVRELNGFSAITGMAGGYIGVQGARAAFNSNLDFHRNLLEMKQTGEMSVRQMAGAKKAIMQLSGQMLHSPQDMLDGLRAFIPSATGAVRAPARRASRASSRGRLPFRSAGLSAGAARRETGESAARPASRGRPAAPSARGDLDGLRRARPASRRRPGDAGAASRLRRPPGRRRGTPAQAPWRGERSRRAGARRRSAGAAS